MGLFSGSRSHLWGNDRTAFQKIFEKYFGLLYLYAVKIIRDHEVAADIRIEALVKVYQHGPFGDDAELRNFAYRVVKNSCIDHLRKIKRRNKHHSLYLQTIEISDDWFKTAFDSVETANKVEQLLRSLTPEVKKVMIDYYLNEFTVEDIARKEQKSQETVRKQLQTGRDAIREIENIRKRL